MNTRTPQLRKHATGQWFVKWAGKSRYFGQDFDKAQQKYLTDPKDGLPGWSAWRAARNTKRFPPMQSSLTVPEVVEQFLNYKGLEGGLDLERYYTKHTKRFLHICGLVRADLVRIGHLQKLKELMLRRKFAPKTINHDLQAAKTVLRWAAAMEYMSFIDVRLVRSCPLPEPPDKSMKLPQVKRMIAQSRPNMAAWLAINYLALMRPSEVIRVVLNEGTWESKGIYKITAKGRVRHVVFSALALKWLAKCKPQWSRLDSYSQAVRDELGRGGPHALRHSAASHLHRLGVDRATVDLLLGHLPSRVSRIYAPISWRSLRASAARLRL